MIRKQVVTQQRIHRSVEGNTALTKSYIILFVFLQEASICFCTSSTETKYIDASVSELVSEHDQTTTESSKMVEGKRL